MNKRILITSLLVGIFITSSISSFSQYKTIVFDLEKNFFNEGQPLPFETYIMVNGQVPTGIELIEITVHKSSSFEGTPLFKGIWKKTKVDQTTFNLPVNYKLKQNNEYGFAITYYYNITTEEKSALYRVLGTSIMSYLEQSVSIKNNDIELSKSYNKVYKDMNSIVIQGIQFYQNDLDYAFPGFSEIAKEKLKELSNVNLKENKFYQFTSKNDSTYNERKENFEFFQSKMNELKRLVDSELVAYLNTISYVTAEKKLITNCNTEKGQFILPINLGYGAIYNSGNFDNFSYGSSSS